MAGLSDVLKDIEKMSGKNSVMQGIEVKDVARISLPMIKVNRMLYGGLPKGRMIELAGPESSGKTTTATLVMASYQMQDTRPVFFIDAEGTYDSRWGKKLGVNHSKERFIYWRPENVTAEEVFEGALRMAETGEVGLIILDSIPTLVPQQEDAKNMTEYQMGGVSKPLTVFSRKMQKVLLKNDDVTFIGINQVRDNMSQYGQPTTTPGGRAWRHICSIRLQFKSENVDANGGYLSASAENPAGAKIIVSLVKNKTAPSNRKLAYYIVNFETGFDARLDIISEALTLDIIHQAGASFSYIDNETGEVIKAQGKAKFLEKMTPELLKKIEKEVMEYDN